MAGGHQHHDVVVVGAGSAGCVLAARLSEDPRRRVLLLEAGPDTPDTPSATSNEVSRSFFDDLRSSGRSYTDVEAVRVRGSHAAPYTLGRGIGGSSAVNAMLGTWGMPSDYDHWARDLGCVGWAWSDVAPVFAALPVPLVRVSRAEWGAVDHALVEAAILLGHPLSAGPAPGTLGVGAAWLTRAAGRRVSAADAYLAPARSRANLTVRANTSVSRLILDGRTAVGVELADGEFVEASDVVLSAGAIHSPALLLASGVDRSGIGVGLKDHVSASLVLQLRDAADTSRLAAATLLRWSSATGDGDLQLLALNHVGEPGYGALVAGVMSVHSGGFVVLRDGRIAVHFEMLSDERDLVRLREAARHTMALAATDPFRHIADKVFIDDVGTTVDALADEADLDAWLQRRVGDYVHAGCSCRMGPVDDAGAVVDTSGRVHGHRNLRVCDASIFPDLPAANLHLPTVMVAERISQAMIEVSPSSR